MIVNYCFVFLSLWSFVRGGVEFPLCSSVVYKSRGIVDVGSMLVNCSQSMGSSLLPPSLFDNVPVIVNVSLAFNAIIGIDDVAATVTFDLWMRQYWQDPRWNFPLEMWDSLNSAARFEGLELTQYIREAGLQFWLPDTYILESIAIREQAEMIHLFPDGHLWWSKHIIVVAKQAKFDLKRYPIDNQQFTLTLQSWGFATRYLLLRPFEAGPPPVTFNDDPTLEEKVHRSRSSLEI
jgi:hypothetical protein